MKGLYKFNDFIERWMAFVTPSCLLFGVLFPQIAKHGVPYVPYVFAFITFTGALKSRFRDVANVFKAPWALLVIMLLLHLVIPGVACGVGNLVFPDNANLVTGMVLEFAVPTAVVSMMWVTIYGGNSALTLALIVIDTVLAPFLIPLTLRLFVGSRVTIDMTQMIRRLIFMVAVPALAAMTLNEWNPASSTLLYHLAIASRAASLTVFFENIIRREWQSPYAACMSGYSSNSIRARCFCLSVHLSADLNNR